MDSASIYLRRRGLFLPEIPETSDFDKRAYFARAAKTRAENSHPELTGRGRTLCLERVGESSDSFGKCKELAVQDNALKEKMKTEKEELRKCVEAEDKKCSKELRALLRGLRDLRDSIKAKLVELTTLP